ncbi:MAG: hypothetical protein IT535_09805 [Bauldia sp.]|nr:hypothetical protein [Bauldia sp.]
MSDTPIVYVFRGIWGNVLDNAVVSAAPADLVVTVYGGGGLFGEGGLADAFDGCATYINDETGERYFAVWGRRNASRFRAMLRHSFPGLETRWTRPLARLVSSETRATKLGAAQRRRLAIEGRGR